MNCFSTAKKRLSLVLWLVALHSVFVGIGLIIQIPAVMQFFGYGPCGEHFFPAQGGTFHVIMAIGYAMAAYDPEGFKCLAIFSIIVKAAATLFLLVYYFIFEQIWSVLVSGIGDGLMMLFIWVTWLSHSKSLEQGTKEVASNQ